MKWVTVPQSSSCLNLAAQAFTIVALALIPEQRICTYRQNRRLQQLPRLRLQPRPQRLLSGISANMSGTTFAKTLQTNTAYLKLPPLLAFAMRAIGRSVKVVSNVVFIRARSQRERQRLQLRGSSNATSSTVLEMALTARKIDTATRLVNAFLAGR